MHKQARIARQRGRVAAHIDNALGELPVFLTLGQRRQQIGLLLAGHTGMLGADADLVNIGQCLGQGKRTLTRGIDQPFVGVAVGNQHGRRHLEQIARHEAGGSQLVVFAACGIVASVVFVRTLDQGFRAFDAQHLARHGGDRQREIAQAAEPVDDALVLFRIEQAQRARDQHAVDMRIDLSEV
ncbi:tRNA threonylcarbamoyladenosine biosynthesis protein, partial [Corchorus olitorius]